MMRVPVNVSATLQPIASPGPMPPLPIPAKAFFPITAMEWGRAKTSAAAPFSNISESKKLRYLVIFDWDDTLFPTSAFNVDNGKNIKAVDLLNLGKSVYELLEKYIVNFGVENLCIVINGKKSRVLDSLKMASDLYRSCFDGKDDAIERTELERDHDYFAAIYNTLISSHPVPVISAQDLYAVRYPQQPALWKTRVFKSIVKDHFDLHSGSNDNIYCIVSIGDSDDEYVASQEAKQMVTTLNRLNCSNNIVRLHRIKLKEKPTINEMVNQIRSLMREADVFLTERGSTSVHYVPQNIGK